MVAAKSDVKACLLWFEPTVLTHTCFAQSQEGDVGMAQARVVPPQNEGVGVFDIPDLSQQYM